MKLTDIGEVRKIMESNGLHFRKQFGQNFLINESIPKRIARECGASPDDGIIEIGPGIGTLTRELSEIYSKVVAVEIDSSLIKVLETTLRDCTNVEVIEADILKTDIAELIRTRFPDMRVSVCANLPYYITTPILMHLLESGIKFDYITVMVQKEVAERLCADAGSPEYGAVTAAVSWYGKAKKLFNVSAGNFIPAPKVDSAVISIKLYDSPPAEAEDEKFLMRVIKGAFAKRRKTLANSLSSELSEYTKEEIITAIKMTELDENIRGEKLDINKFAGFSNNILKLRKE